MKNKKGRFWSPEATATVVKSFKEYENGSISKAVLEKKYGKTLKQIIDKVRYMENGPRPSATDKLQVVRKHSGKNGKGQFDLNQIMNMLKDAKLGRGWKGKVKNALTNPTPSVKWDKETEERTVAQLENEHIAHLILGKNGLIRVYSESGYMNWKKGHRRGLINIHGDRLKS